MNGFQPYIASTSSLKRLETPHILLKPTQKGSGIGPSIKIVSPTAQVVNQAKESLKRNKEEVKELTGGTPVKKAKKANSKKSSGSKSSKIHIRYRKK